jgi:glycosyltransferase involved in cell wall biosynthesis
MPLHAVQLLFVDNESSDGSARWLAANLPPNAQLLHCPRARGPYAARNVGVAAARAPALAFTDADCQPSATWLVEGLRVLAAHDQAAGRIVLRRAGRPTWVEALDSSRFLRQERYVDEAFGATANLFVRRSVLETIGLFDERLLSGGDQELGARAHESGYSIAYAERAVVVHRARRGFRELLAKAHRVGVGFGHCHRAHSLQHAAGRERFVDRLALIAEAGSAGGLAFAAGHVALAASTFVGCAQGYFVTAPARDRADPIPRLTAARAEPASPPVCRPRS